MPERLQDYLKRKLRQGDLGTLPHVLCDLLRVLDAPQSGARDLERIISGDPAISARILRLANSAMYGLPRKISDLTHAIALIGSTALRRTILSTTAFDAYFQRGTVIYHRTDLWKQSLRSACLARSLALRQRKAPAESLFIAGLLHHLGYVVLDQFAHHIFTELLEVARGRGNIINLERTYLGTTHAEIGFWVAEVWHLPPVLAQAIRWHHEPFKAGEFMLAAQIVAAADILNANPGEVGLEWSEAESEAIMKALRLTDVARQQVIGEAESEYREMEEYFRWDGRTGQPHRAAAV